MSNGINDTISEAKLGGSFTFPGKSLTVQRIGYGAMQLAGPGVWGPPKDQDGAVAVLREAVASGVNHIDTSDFYGPHVTNQIIRRALHPYPAGLAKGSDHSFAHTMGLRGGGRGERMNGCRASSALNIPERFTTS
jgi:hypothetical protein